MKAIKLRELIKILQAQAKEHGPDILVGISFDSEGNGWSLIANEQLCSIENNVSNELGSKEFGEEDGTQKALVLWGTN
jgi:hypothetical protein